MKTIDQLMREITDKGYPDKKPVLGWMMLAVLEYCHLKKVEMDDMERQIMDFLDVTDKEILAYLGITATELSEGLAPLHSDREIAGYLLEEVLYEAMQTNDYEDSARKQQKVQRSGN